MSAAAIYTTSDMTMRLDTSGIGGTLTGAGVFLGNGKIGLVTSFDGVALVDSCVITATSTSQKTKYTNNTIESFNPFQVNFFNDGNGNKDLFFGGSNLQAVTSIVQSNQSINMATAIFTNEITVATATAGSGSGSNISNQTVFVSTDIYTPRNLPFCTVQTIRLTPGSNVTSIPMYHQLSCLANISEPEFNNSVVYNNVGHQPVYIMSGKGNITGGVAACACAYVFECSYTNLGFNVFVDKPNVGFNFFQLNGVSPGTTVRVHIISAHMTTFDFDSPLDEAKKVVLNVLNRTMNSIRSDHVKQWSMIWDSDVTIMPKSGITTGQAATIVGYKQFLKYSLYNIYSSVREGVNLEVNPATFGFIDATGTALYSGDMSLVPLLILLKPEFARGILDYRYRTLGIASQLAAGYGYSGAKFPYATETLGYRNALYWNTTTNLTIFNTAMISVNIWNYYRLVKDTEWLRSIGYPILKANAEFFASFIELSSDNVDGDGDGYGDGEGGCGCGGYGNSSGGSQSINGIVSLAGVLSASNNAFTNSLVKLAMRYAVECSYELSLAVPDVWIDYYQRLSIPMVGDLIKFDAATLPPDALSPAVAIPEPLFLFTPLLSEETKKHHENIAYLGIDYLTMLRDNVIAYSPDAVSANPLCAFVFGTLDGLYSQYDPSFVTNFEADVTSFIHSNATGSWRNFDDVTISALFVLMMVQGIPQLNIQGGVAPTRFYYNELVETSLTSANMPSTWKVIKIGVKKRVLVTQNIVSYVG